MSADKFDLNQAYQTAFNHVRAPFPLLVAESKTYGISPVGTVKALGSSFKLKTLIGTDFTAPTKIDDWQLPNEPTISIRSGKRVLDTQLNRLDPSSGKIERKNVLEEVGINNYEVRLRGVIYNDTDYDSYPEADVRRLREVIEKAGSVKIENGILTLFNIGRVAIVNYDFFEVRGYIGAQAYELILLQDENLSLELELNEPERA